MDYLVLGSGPVGTEKKGIVEIPAPVSENIRVEIPRRVQLEIVTPDNSLVALIVPKRANGAKHLVTPWANNPYAAALMLTDRFMVPHDKEHVWHSIKTLDATFFTLPARLETTIESGRVNRLPKIRSLHV